MRDEEKPMNPEDLIDELDKLIEHNDTLGTPGALRMIKALKRCRNFLRTLEPEN